VRRNIKPSKPLFLSRGFILGKAIKGLRKQIVLVFVHDKALAQCSARAYCVVILLAQIVQR